MPQLNTLTFFTHYFYLLLMLLILFIILINIFIPQINKSLCIRITSNKFDNKKEKIQFLIFNKIFKL